jgi:hypothetical protein
MPITNWIRNNDFFGFPIKLNFNKKESDHKSFLGGLVSIIIKSIIVVYSLAQINALI